MRSPQRAIDYFLECYDEAFEMFESGAKLIDVAKAFDVGTSTAHRWKVKMQNEGLDNEMVEHAAQQSKSRQKFMDKNRIREKVLREGFRKDNALEEMTKEFIKLLDKNSFTGQTKSHRVGKTNGAAIVQLSDLHFNELIELPHNKYNFKVASARLHLLAQKTKQYLESFKIKNLVIAMTGDMMNSDRRLDEKLSMATNRTQATFLAVDLLEQFILDLNQDFNITVLYVTGNESRVADELTYSKKGVTDSYDTTIFHMLERLFRDCKGVSFIYNEDDPSELPLTIGPVNVLFTHGLKMGKDVEKTVEMMQGRYANRDKIIHYVICGHLHSARIGDTYGRSSSLAGSNSYNEGGLNLYGRASQNLYIIHEDGLRDGIKIDLQSCETSAFYPFNEKLEAYNAKSHSKTKKRTVSFEVVI